MKIEALKNNKKRKGFILPFVCVFMAFICSFFTSASYYVDFLGIYISNSVFILIYTALCAIFLAATKDKSCTEFDDILRSVIIIEMLPALRYCINVFWIVLTIYFFGFLLYLIVYDKVLESNGMSKAGMTESEKRKAKSFSTRITCEIMIPVLSIIIAIGVFQGTFNDSIDNIANSLSIRSESSFNLSDEQDELKIEKPMAEKMKNWRELRNKEKAAILEEILNNECKHLGIKGIKIVYEDIKSSETAYYKNSKKEIVIKYDSLSDSLLENINTVCHECFHAYEYYTVEHADFCSDAVQNDFYYRQIRLWKKNIGNYTDSKENYEQYRTQPLEADAFSYGDEREMVYKNAILSVLKS